MTSHGPDNHTALPDRREELLIDQALMGLTQAEQQELAGLERGIHDESFEIAAAELELALFEHEAQEAPAEITQALLRTLPSAANASSDDRMRIDSFQVTPAAKRFQSLGWVAAAAGLVIAALAWMPPTRPSIERQRSALIQSGASVTSVAWQALDDPSVSSFVEGDVVWSDEKQEGYMRFVGLSRNDPSREQYQLWIFDSTRSADHPVDGGVFDVGSDGEVIVPINAKIRVRDAAMFAVTVEPPGGVVVSDRSRLPLLAQRPQG